MRAAVDCGETDGGGVREEMVVGNASGGEPGSRECKAIPLSHTEGLKPSPEPLSPHTPASAAEQ